MAPLPIRYCRAAVDEMDEATQWYARQGQDLANQFRQVLRDKIAEARRSPHHWPLQEDGTRQVHLAPFSYILVFRNTQGFLEIVALSHTSRMPDYWQDRLD